VPVGVVGQYHLPFTERVLRTPNEGRIKTKANKKKPIIADWLFKLY
jgi:hypothetical protein